MTSETISGGEAIVRALRANGIDAMFGVPGAQIYPLFDGLLKTGLPVYVPRHEQSAGYMAMGYAKSTGRTAACCAVPGPGVLNASAALLTAAGNCSPLVCVTGQVPSDYLGRGRGHLHEMRDQLGTLKGIVKDAMRIDSPQDAQAVINRAVQTSRAGRPGPVAVEMCWDTMAATTDARSDPPLAPLPPPEPDPDAVDAAARALGAASKPMIVCGAGAQDAADEVLALAELLDAPVTAFRSGRGVVAEDHPLAAPPVAARELFDDVDVLVGIGSRLEMPAIRWRDPMRYESRPEGWPMLIRIDIDPDEMHRLEPDVAIVADAAEACRQLTERLAVRKLSTDAGRRDEIAAANRLARTLIRKLQPQAAYLEAIRDVLPRDGFLVPELSQMGFATYTGAFEVLRPRSYVTEGYQGTLGFGFPTSLGVKIANPDRAVVSICGDGGFMFAAAELATAVQYSIGVTVIVVNNGGYGNVIRDQQTLYDGRVIGSRLTNPDFLKLADSFGIDAERVERPRQLRPALERALGDGAPRLIEIVAEPAEETSPWPLIHMRERPSRW